MNPMNLLGNMPANQVAGVAPNMGMHMPQQGPMMQQQPGVMIQSQQSPMMQQQQGPMMQPQSGSIMQQQTGTMIQQSSAMMQQQPGTMIQQPPGAMMQQQPGTMMQQTSPQQMQTGQGLGPGPGPNNMAQQLPPDKMDSISKLKTLMGSLRDSISMTLKAAAQVLHQNHTTDDTSQKDVTDPTTPRFDKNLEEFYALCDQMELHLKTAVTCIQQAHSAGHYLPLTVIPSRLDVNTQDTMLSYPTFLNTVRLQISYAKDIHDTLIAAAQNIAPTE